VPVGQKVLVTAPGLPKPDSQGRRADSGRHRHRDDHPGRRLRQLRRAGAADPGADGQVTEVKLAGSRLSTEAALAAELVGRYEC